MKYKGIELEGLDKKVKLSHSRVMETDEGTDWIDKLLADPVPRGQRSQLRHQHGLPDLQRRHQPVRLQRLPRGLHSIQ